VLSGGKVRLLHPQKRIEQRPIFEFERNEKVSTQVAGEATASKPSLNANRAVLE
jgi:hypothetical protein